ncbi:AI-2E family transporter [Myxococcaceae bacterium GXIMD 01537]
MAPPRPSQVNPRTVWTVGLHAMALVALALIFYELRSLLVLLATSLMVALALEPLVRLGERLGLRRGLGVLVAVLTVLGVVALMAVTVVPMVAEQVRNLIGALPGFITRVRDSEWMHSLDERFHVFASAQRELGSLPGKIAGSAVSVVGTTVGALTVAVTVLTVSIFGLLSGRQLFLDALAWVPPARRRTVYQVVMEMQRAVSGYLVGVLFICLLGAIFTSGMCFLLGVPFFLALGLMYLVLGFVPYIGSFLVAVTVSLTTLATVGFRRALIALVLFMAYQQLEGNVLQPLIQRRALQMNPLIITVVIVAGAVLMGVMGAVLALPLAAAIQVLLQRVLRVRQVGWRRAAFSARTPQAPPREPPEDSGPPLHH